MARSAFLLAALLLPAPAFAQQSAPQESFTPAQRAEIVAIMRSALKTDPTILRDAVLALQRGQADQQEAASNDAITANRAAIYATPGDPIAGNPKGSVTLVEFYDARCPYCRKMLPVLDQFLAQTPSVRLILKDLPILGPSSVLASQAMLAAQGQGGYLKMQHALMADGVTIDAAFIQKSALAAGLDWGTMQKAMGGGNIAARIAANIKLATTLGIDGTPALIINGHLVPGAMTLDQLQQAVAGKP